MVELFGAFPSIIVRRSVLCVKVTLFAGGLALLDKSSFTVLQSFENLSQ